MKIRKEYPDYCFDPRKDNISKMFCYGTVSMEKINTRRAQREAKRVKKCRNQFKGSV